ncbi:MAG: glycine--tRNA ligase [Candidatus Saliniplasma sp.]
MVDKEDLESMCKRRGFVWQSAEIYGGESGFYDYGHLGTKLKENWKRAWKDFFLGLDENYHLLDTTNILPYKALEASGHVDHFSDVLIKCERCGSTFRGDHVIEEETGENAEWMGLEEIKTKINDLDISCSDCGGDFSDPEDFNMMFELEIGPTGDTTGFLRPETAQGIYLNFSREYRALRKRMPMGLGTIGRAYRNEISPRQGIFRQREFEQAELQIFFVPEIHNKFFKEKYKEENDTELRVKRADRDEAEIVDVQELEDIPEFFLYHLMKIYEFYRDVMEIDAEDLRLRELSDDEKAFYNKIHFDLEIYFDTLGGWKEVDGLHYRSDYDLKKHQERSGQKMSIPTDDGRKIPHVVEISFGVDRNIWALLDKGYKSDDRTWLNLPPKLAPYSGAVFPLVRKDGLPEKAREIFEDLDQDLDVFWDKSGSIGKRYARQDEIGTPYCMTVDYDTVEEDTITIREIRSSQQIRVGVEDLKSILKDLLKGKKAFKEYLND